MGSYLSAPLFIDSEYHASLRAALTSRAVIDQAKGVIMAVRRVDADHAFMLMVEQSQNQNIKVRDLAQQFVTAVVDDDGRGG